MSGHKTFAQQFLAEAGEVIARLDSTVIERAAGMLAATRAGGGRLFILGVGGSAANASHAVNDFRKIAGIEAYAPTDNVSELTARVNDEGWATVFDRWLKTSRLRANDLVLVFSVGGGNLELNVSPNLVAALKYAKTVGAKIIGVVGRDGGYTAEVADACVLIPSVNPAHITPHVEAFQAVVWHLLVTHPAVKIEETKWESTTHPEKSRRAVFLDRDGVINRAIVRDGTPHSPATLDELQIFPDVPAALRKLKQLGFQLLVITNQPDVSRGTRTREAVENINNKLSASLPLDDIMVCYHTDADNCTCRKPKPGMILDAARKYDIDLSVSYLVGDRWRDIEAGKNAGCTTIWIDAGYRESQPVRGADARVGSLREAADWIIQAAAKGAAR
ncbi:MAG TPA: HAD-IIIA family hydrolase [Candidatus Acidoferrales bacterium]|nr:HAD-IIIA family hydrolase [Candidatus Acidoferrales bacterium]